jgi:uncharacterized protein
MTMGETYNFNITFNCNSNCSFCAADLRIPRTSNHKRREIPLSKFVSILDDLKVGSGDDVIISGGEPTVHKDFFGFLENVKKRGAQLSVFSNGRLFASRQFAERLLHYTPISILIPLYSIIPEVHDGFTGQPGSLTQTLQGIRNLFSLQESGADIFIEFRLLLSRFTNLYSPAVVKYILENFSSYNFDISLSTLCVSEKARSGGHVAPLRDMIPLIAELDRDIRLAGRTPRLAAIPKCILWEIRPGLALESVSTLEQMRKGVPYFDPYKLDVPPSQAPVKDFPLKCQNCKLIDRCPGFSVSHLKVLGDIDASPISERDYLKVANQTLIKLISPEDKIDVSGASKIALPNGEYIWIEPETGSWYSPSSSDIMQLFCDSNQTVAQLREADPEMADNVIAELLFSGVGRINGTRLVSVNCVNEAMQECDGLGVIVLKYTTRCNLKCSYCYARSEGFNHKDMPNDILNEIVAKFANGFAPEATLVLHGGEPLLRFNDIIKFVKDVRNSNLNKRLTVGMQTNATLITPQIAQMLKQNEVRVGVSVDGHDLESNRHRRYADDHPSLGDTLKGLLNLINAGITPAIMMVASSNNVKQLLESMKYFYEIGVKNFAIVPLYLGGAAKNMDSNAFATPEDMAESLLSILLWINDTNAQANPQDCVHERELAYLVKSLTSYARDFMCASVPCGAGSRTLAIGADGSIYPCDDFMSDEFRIGSIYDIEDIVGVLSTNPIVLPLKKRRLSDLIPCAQCTWRAICPDHCAVKSYSYSGDIYHPGVMCETMQILIPQTIELLISGRIDKNNIVQRNEPLH